LRCAACDCDPVWSYLDSTWASWPADWPDKLTSWHIYNIRWFMVHLQSPVCHTSNSLILPLYIWVLREQLLYAVSAQTGHRVIWHWQGTAAVDRCTLLPVIS